ncbi:uncharacterized protein N7483_011531 [Penicillium malachiteum]|uniref:uncharacterized protein n=1 Tax=Penicillium malachiteum TaxID=1324776 RepID=UPI0025496303|nr:uncharacterized protein N7483_011531 [Penicillium malachiteum]KAJ5714350.1 hypothetical protein N7483_011531 [Penicillium malachiteum]
MRLLPGLLTIYLWGILVQASSWSQSIDSQPTPHANKRAQISSNKTDITGFHLQAGAFTIDHVKVERTQVGICERVPFGTEACRSIIGYLVSFTEFTGEAIRELYGEDSCNAMLGTYESLSWFYHSSGRDCNRKWQRTLITNAIKEYLKDTDVDRFRGTECLRLDEGGAMDGCVKLGPTASFSSKPYCDSHSEL